MTTAGAAHLHRVQRLTVVVRGARSSAQGLAWRRALLADGDDAWTRGLGLALDRVAEAHGLGSDTWHLPRVTVAMRLTTTDAEAMAAAVEEAFPQAVAQALEQALAARPAERIGRHGQAQSVLWTYLAEGRVPWHADDRDPQRVRRALRSAAADWWRRARADGAMAWPDAMARTHWHDGSWAALRPAAARLAALLDDDVFEQLRTHVLAAEAKWVDDDLGAPPNDPGANSVHAPAGGRTSPSDDAAASAAHLNDRNDRARWVWRWWRDAMTGSPSAARASTAARRAEPDPRSDPRHSAGTLPRGVDTATPRPTEASHHADEGPAIEPIARPDAAPDAPARWLAHDAGLVLLHPYLPTLLDAIGCALPGRGEWQADSLARAAAMLGWLTTGHDEIQEFQLTVSRVLLGLQPDTPIALTLPSGRIDDTMRQEGHSLLEAVIGHWSALGRTSPDSLRLNFLARDGLLSRASGRPWQLHLGEEPYDVLLRRLPWGIGLVRLPWMPDTLQVHWGDA